MPDSFRRLIFGVVFESDYRFLRRKADYYGGLCRVALQRCRVEGRDEHLAAVLFQDWHHFRDVVPAKGVRVGDRLCEDEIGAHV